MPEGAPAADRATPNVFTIPVHRRFADALAAGIVERHGRGELGLARGIVILPSARAVTAVRDAFVRRAEPAMLLPRLVALGDAGEAIVNALFEAPEAPPPPAVEPLVRQLVLARLVQQERAERGMPVDAAAALRLANDLARVFDELAGEEVRLAALDDLAVAPELQDHWRTSLVLLKDVAARWSGELERLGRIDLAERRARLLRHAAEAWRGALPARWIVAAGITTPVLPVARLLRTLARADDAAVVFPGLDLDSGDDEWRAIAAERVETHPQFQLNLLLERIAVARSDVRVWPGRDGHAQRPQRSATVSQAFAPAQFTGQWESLKGTTLPGVELAEFATPAGEAQGIAIALRELLEQPGKTAALVTPDRALAGRVAAQLKRWGIDADDSAGRPLAATPPGTLLIGLAELASERFAPVALLGVLKHPLVRQGDERLAWLDAVRTLDLALRGPRPAPGLAAVVARAGEFGPALSAALGPLEAAFEAARGDFGAVLEAVRSCAEALCGDAVWRGVAGRAAGTLFAGLAEAAGEAPHDFEPRAIAPMLAALMRDVAVRPPQGGHPRIAILGPIEARLQSADLVVLGGLNEGVWPTLPAPDPWLAARVRREIGLGALDRRIGVAAHDLAGHLGARDVLLTRAGRDAQSATVPSRFLLRLDAMLGGVRRNRCLPALAAAIDAAQGPPQPCSRPAPIVPRAARPRTISVTAVDRLVADPFAFYARSILRLSSLEPVDGEPSFAWRGTVVHDIFHKWVKHDGMDPVALQRRVGQMFDDPATNPVLRVLWAPRLAAAVEWMAEETLKLKTEGRVPIATECAGGIDIAGVRLAGKADRIDRVDGGLVVLDYKTGGAPKSKAVEAGYSLQLGLLGLIAERGGFAEVAGRPVQFEYWSLAKNDGKFGARKSPFRKNGTVDATNFTAHAAQKFGDAASEWLTGDAPFTAKLVPDYAPFTEYDQLMRLGEWYGREN